MPPWPGFLLEAHIVSSTLLVTFLCTPLLSMRNSDHRSRRDQVPS